VELEQAGVHSNLDGVALQAGQLGGAHRGGGQRAVEAADHLAADVHGVRQCGSVVSDPPDHLNILRVATKRCWPKRRRRRCCAPPGCAPTPQWFPPIRHARIGEGLLDVLSTTTRSIAPSSTVLGPGSSQCCGLD